MFNRVPSISRGITGAEAMTTTHSKEDDYTLCVTTSILNSRGSLTRYFNFAAEQVTSVFSERAELKDSKAAGGYDGGVSVAVAVALTSQLQVQKFSDFDSQTEIELMREKLISLQGNPPAASGSLPKPKTAGLG